MLEQIAAQLLPHVADMVAAVIALLAAAAIDALRRKLRSDYARGVLHRIEDVAFTAVAGEYQRFVEDAKLKAADGRLTKDEARAALASAEARIRDGLGRSGVREATRILGGEEALRRFLRAQIEAAVLALKRQAPGTARLGEP